MPWVRTDDNTPNHPKMFHAGVAAYGFWTASLAYCARNLTDGSIPARDLALIFPGTPHDEQLALSEVLVRERLWETTPIGWHVHDYLDFQPSRKDTEHHRRWRSRVGRQGGEKSAQQRKQNASHSAEQDAAHSLNPDPTRPDPTRPDPIEPSRVYGLGTEARDAASPNAPAPAPPKSKKDLSLTGDQALTFARFWTAYPNHEAKQDAIRAWKRLSPDDALVTVLLGAIDRQKQGRKWREGIIPHPATWLNGRRWEDEPELAGIEVATSKTAGNKAALEESTRRILTMFPAGGPA